MSQNRRAGIIYIKVDGELYDAAGDFTYNLGKPSREALSGADGIHGYKETPQPAFIEGEIRDSNSLDLATLLTLDGVTVTLELNNGKVIVLRDAWFAGEGGGSTGEATIAARFESRNEAEEVK